MAFAQRKFLALSSQQQARHLARMLAGALDNATLLDDYNKAVGWLGRRELRCEKAVAARLGELYVHWQSRTGRGPERRVLLRLGIEGDADIARAPPLNWAVFLPDIRSAHNVGAIVRTCDCFGFRTVFRCGYTPGPEQPGVQSAAMGTQDWISIVSVGDLEDARKRFGSGDQAPAVVALETGPGAMPLGEVRWPQSGILILGNEQAGISEKLKEQSDLIVSIPVYGRKASLNVANAFAIAAWEIRRSRDAAHFVAST
ncbi:MAG: hypothetical protein H7A21_18400 [Spirochaetales bacterium]|nr:hypothetical protein [Leptospiraceae bacterium]MCP5483413.1 hypothetical protein [Spirochaetales bacterium]MCP5486774.1 hypothetical protein [Spirochaetales bacterium]